MAIAHDAVSNSASGTGNLSWTHTPTGTPRGVLVLIGTVLSATDGVTAVTYGGVTVPRVTGGFVGITGGQLAAAHAYFLGTGIPTGPQTVSVTVSGAVTRQAMAITQTAAADTVVDAIGTVAANGTSNPTITVATTASTTTAVYAVGAITENSASVSVTAPDTQLLESGNTVTAISFAQNSTLGAGGNVVIGWTFSNDSIAGIAVAIKESAGGGGTDYTQAIDDGITGADVIAKVAAQSRNDGIAGTDSRTTAWVASRTIADAAALADAAAKSSAHPLADAAALTDASARSVKHPLADGGALTDAASKTASHTIADAGALTDAPTHAWAARLPLSDTGALTDNINTGGATGHTKAIDDGIAATDATAKTATHPLADAIGASDAAAKAVAHPVADGIAGTDARAKTAGHSVADPIAATDTPTHAWAAKVTQADPAALTDSANTGGSTNHTRTINDAIGGTDAIAKAPAHPVTDVISATDARARQIATALAELVALTDAPARQWTARLAFGDTASIGDLLTINARRWLITPQPHWGNPTGSRWDVDPSTRWPAT